MPLIRPMASGVLLVCSVLVAYGGTLQSPFLFDDETNIVHNGFLKIEELSLDSISHVLTAPHPSPRRKLANLSFAFNFVWCGLRPHCYHLANIAIHCVAGLLAFGFFYQLLGAAWLKQRYGTHRLGLAWTAAALWALHPINLNAVTYIVQRMTSMAGMFGLLSLNCWLLAREAGQSRRNIQVAFWGAFSCISWVLGMMSKENLILLPLMIVATEVFLFRKGEFRVPWRLLVFSVIVIGAWLFSFDLWRFWRVLDGYANRDFTLTERLLTQSRVLWHYISLFFFPVADRFALLYEYPISRGLFSPLTTFPALVGWVLLPILLWKHRKKWSVPFWVLLWFLCGHLLESTILPLEIIFEHRNYLPSLSLALGTVLGAKALAERFAVRLPIQIFILCTFTLIVAGSTYTRNLDFKDARTFYEREFQKFPASRRLGLNLAVTYNRMGDYPKGLALLETLAVRHPKDIAIRQNLYFFWSEVAGNDLRANTILTGIKALIENGHYVAKKDGAAVRRLAVHLRGKGDYREALFFVEKLLEDFFHLDSVWVLKGKLHADLNEWDAARDAFKKGLSLRPDDYAISFWYGRSLIETGAVTEGCRHLWRATRDPVNEDTSKTSKNLFKEKCEGFPSATELQ